MPADPIRRFRSWLAEARRAGVALPEAMALATADARGRPSVRYVLLKQADQRGFVFYTNALSRKGRELARSPHASLAVYWDPTGKQVRVEGRVGAVSEAEADAYWAERPWTSQVASLASAQSATLASRADLLKSYRRLARRYEGREVPRPKRWTGYRLAVDRIEFWTRHEPRLHHRELFVRKGRNWQRKLLQP